MPKKKPDLDPPAGYSAIDFSDDELLLLCLLFKATIAWNQGRMESGEQHSAAFVTLWDNLGTSGRIDMAEKVHEIAITCGYPERAIALLDTIRGGDSGSEDEDTPIPGFFHQA
jgi:hypothetical protein